MAIERDLSFDRGMDFSQNFHVYTASGNVDLTGYSFFMKVREDKTNHSLEYLSLNTTNGYITITNPPASGLFVVSIPSAISNVEWESGYYDLFWTDSLSKSRKLVYGSICVNPTVSIDD